MEKEDLYLFESLDNGNHLEDYELLKAQKIFNRIEKELKRRLV